MSKPQPIEGTRSISVWWQVGIGMLTAAFCCGVFFNSSQARFEHNEADIAKTQVSIADLRRNGPDNFVQYSQDTTKRLDGFNTRLEKLRDGQTQIIRVIARLAEKAGVSDE